MILNLKQKIKSVIMFINDCARRGGFSHMEAVQHPQNSLVTYSSPLTTPPLGRSGGTTAQVAVWSATTFPSPSLDPQ